MKKCHFLILLVIAAVSCKEQFNPVPVSVTFRAGLEKYETKATDNSFENGDSLALWAEGGVTASCIPLVCSGTSFMTPTPLYWTDLGSAGASFTAMYPFAVSRMGTVFSVKTDQSTHAAYTASDLMIGSCNAEHGTKEVALPMRHQLCQIAVCVNNELEDPVSEVLLDGVKCSMSFSKSGTGAVSGKAVTVKTAAATIEGGSAYVALLPLQEFDFSVEVITAGGVHFKYKTGPFKVDESGVQIRFDLVLNSLSLSCTPEPYLTGWSLPLIQDSSSIPPVSLGCFISLPLADKSIYRISGKIANVAEPAFSLTDAVDTVAVGKLLSPSCIPDVQFAAADLKEGDFLRVYGAHHFAEGTASMPSAVYVNHAMGLSVSASEGESFVWTGVADLADWSSELIVPATSFTSVAAGSKLRVHLSAVFGNFWTLSLYSGAMDPLSFNLSGSASAGVAEIDVTETIATALKASGLVVRGTAVVGAVGV